MNDKSLQLGKKIRIKDIAQKAGVSTGTVDRVLHNRGEVNAKTRKKVLDIVDALGYVPNLFAKSLASKTKSQFTVLLPIADSDHAYWHLPLEGISRAAEDLKDYNAVINIKHFDPASSDSFKTAFDEAIASQPEGIVFTPVFEKIAQANALRCRELNIPLLCLEINLEGDTTLGYFGQDAKGSGCLAGKLMDLILPEKSSILLLNLTRKMTITPHLRRRSEGFISYFDAPAFNKDIHLIPINLDIRDQIVLRESLLDAFANNPDIKGIYVTSSQAHRVALSLQNIGRKDVVLIGHDMITKNLNFLEEGIIDLLIVHRPHENAYNCVVGLFNHVNGIKSLERSNLSSIDVVLKENMNYYINKRTQIK